MTVALMVRNPAQQPKPTLRISRDYDEDSELRKRYCFTLRQNPTQVVNLAQMIAKMPVEGHEELTHGAGSR
jgi:hypothetical protein